MAAAGRSTGSVRRRWLARSLAALAGIGCAACCMLPGLLIAGVVGGAGWTILGRAMPGIALGLVAFAVLAWWWSGRHTAACPSDCSCRYGAASPPADADDHETRPAPTAGRTGAHRN